MFLPSFYIFDYHVDLTMKAGGHTKVNISTAEINIWSSLVSKTKEEDAISWILAQSSKIQCNSLVVSERYWFCSGNFSQLLLSFTRNQNIRGPFFFVISVALQSQSQRHTWLVRTVLYGPIFCACSTSGHIPTLWWHRFCYCDSWL